MKNRIHRLETELMELTEFYINSESPVGAGNPGVGDTLENISFNITRSVTGFRTDVDVTLLALPMVMSRLSSLATRFGLHIFVYCTDGVWREYQEQGPSSKLHEAKHSGFVELAIVDRDMRLDKRYSVARWITRDSSLICRSLKAPVNRADLQRIRRGYSDIGRVDEIGPVDAVYTWVDADDPQWREAMLAYRPENEIDLDRYRQFDELKYSIRSVDLFAPWIRKVFVFSNCRPPEWFAGSDRVEWIYHEDVIDEKFLPTFNSHAIETFLHEMPGLSENFLYFNDDVLLSGFVRPRDFFTTFGQGVSRLEPYGMVPYFIDLIDAEEAEEWQAAVTNGARLLSEDIGVFPTQIHRHSPHSMKKSTYRELSAKYPDEMESTRASRFRTKTDYTFASFIYHHFALARGEAVENNEEAYIIRAKNYQKFLAERAYLKQRFFCVNDGGGSSADEGYTQFKKGFLPKLFPFKSRAEI